MTNRKGNHGDAMTLLLRLTQCFALYQSTHGGSRKAGLKWILIKLVLVW